MTEAAAEPVNSADDLYAIVAARPEAEGLMQADAMMVAATALLINRNGVENTIAALGQLAERVRASKVVAGQTAGAPEPAPVVAPQPLPHAELVGQALGHLRGLPVDHALAQANAAMTAAGQFIAETFGGGAPIAAPKPAAISPEHLACALVDQLRAMHRGEAHERARATVVGAAAYLNETFGRSYAGALLDGTLQAAAAHGDAMRGGRDSLDTLH